MKHLRIVLAFLVVAALLVCVSSQADAQKKKKRKKGKAAVGQIVKIDNKNGEGTITIKMTNKKKKTSKELTFKFNKDTKIVLAGRRKKGQPAVAINLDQLKEGQRVRVLLGASPDDPVRSIQLFKGRKKKKGA